MINLLVVCDDNYIQHACCMLDSVLNTTSAPVSVYLVYDDITPANLDRFSTYLASKNVPFWSCQIATREYEHHLPVGAHFSLAGYLKILAVEQLPVDKVLYIDPDVIALSDISALWNIDLGTKLMAAVEEQLDDLSYLSGFADAPYFNSGVMLLDVKGLKQFGLGERFAGLSAEQTSEFRYIDQDALNLLLKDQWLALHPVWNQLPSLTKQRDSGKLQTISPAACKEALASPALVHFAGGRKPWLFMPEMPYKDRYWHALSHTPWRGYRSPDLSLYHRYVKWRRRLLGGACRTWLKQLESNIRNLLRGRSH